jgi:hypothetical protein
MEDYFDPVLGEDAADPSRVTIVGDAIDRSV